MRFAWIAFCALAWGAPAFAQTPPPPPSGTPVVPAEPAAPRHVHGTIVSFDGNELQVKTDAGDAVSAAVGPDSLILFDEPKRFADIKAGDFLGIAATTGSDGTFHAQEVRIFPESLRGMGEGQYPMGDPASGRTMTNATVAIVNAVFNGGTLALSFHGAGTPGDSVCSGHAAAGGAGCVGQTTISIAPGVPVIAYTTGDKSLLIPGAEVVMVVATDSGGAATARRLLVEHNGVKPI